MSDSRRTTRPRTLAPGGEGGVQPPLLNTVVNNDNGSPPPSPTAPAREDDDLLEVLKKEGVRITRVIMRDFDAGRIRAALEAYREADDGGPGLLVWMIRESCEPRRSKQSGQERDWLERRMEIHEQRQRRVS